MNRTFKWAGLLVLQLILATQAHAQVKRALLIGINNYAVPQNQKTGLSGRKIRNLAGCVNDITAMRSVLKAKFDFAEKDIISLQNEAATRNAIMEGMKNLLSGLSTNDFAVIYYSGHGSQVKNIWSPEPDQLDETIVPADSWKAGIEDLRDKELSAMFNQFIDKGIKLTVMFDCCHSGSLARGPGLFTANKKFTERSATVVQDNAKAIPPQEREDADFLLLAASQDNEPALEQLTDNEETEGAFTIALLKAIHQLPLNCTPNELFTALRAILKSNSQQQEPVLAVSPKRKNQTLFGFGKNELKGIRVAVSGWKYGKIMVQGGFVLGLNKGSLLSRTNGTDTTIIKIDSVYGLNLSSASLVSGNESAIEDGFLFDIKNWVPSQASLLKVYIPESGLDYTALSKMAHLIQQFSKSGKAKIITDLSEKLPALSVYCDNKKWYVNHSKGTDMIGTLTEHMLYQLSEKAESIYIELPPDVLLKKAVRDAFSQNENILFTKTADEADYILFGSVDHEGFPGYGLRKKDISPKDSLESMPNRSAIMALANTNHQEVAAFIYETAMKLSKIRGWLQLTPPSTPETHFPYHLELVDKQTNQPISNGQYTIGDTVLCKLMADDDDKRDQPSARFIYVFVIDKEGKMSLLYPGSICGNKFERIPQFNGANRMQEYTLCELEVAKPSGTDNYYLLATDQQITDPQSAFNQEGVRGNTIAQNSPLGKLLNMGNKGFTTRGLNTAENWSLRRLSVKAVY